MAMASCQGCADRDAEIASLKAKLADLKGEPRPGEDFELTLGAMGMGGYAYTATDRKTGLAVHVDGEHDDVRARGWALSYLRQCLKDPEGTQKEHWPTCRCDHCFWKEYHENLGKKGGK